jgi:hypothetical protein
MATTEWKSDFAESFVNVGIEKGLTLAHAHPVR